MLHIREITGAMSASNRDLPLQVAMVLITMILFVAMLAINDWIFNRSEFTRGINWVYLPAGMRLLCTLLFAEEGAVGLLLAGWLTTFVYFFPDDHLRAFVGGIFNALAPYLVYRLARLHGLQASLVNLTPVKLLVMIFACAIASPLLHHIWFALQGQHDLLRSLTVMVAGDLSGTLIVIYTAKLVLAALRPA